MENGVVSDNQYIWRGNQFCKALSYEQVGEIYEQDNGWWVALVDNVFVDVCPNKFAARLTVEHEVRGGFER